MSFFSSKLLVRGLDTYVYISIIHISIDPQIPNNQRSKTLTHVCAPDRIRIRDPRLFDRDQIICEVAGYRRSSRNLSFHCLFFWLKLLWFSALTFVALGLEQVIPKFEALTVRQQKWVSLIWAKLWSISIGTYSKYFTELNQHICALNL
jgi:hypothetical protein